MKSLSYILFALLFILMYGCKEEDHPYVGYLVAERAVLEPEGGSHTQTVQTDLSDPLMLIGVTGDWCEASVNGKEVTVTTAQANPSNNSNRTATVTIRCGYRQISFTVLQKYVGQDYLEYDWTGWQAVGSDVEQTDGGGFTSLFKDDRTTFWHSQYNPPLEKPLPHWIRVDMQKELTVDMVRIGRRHYAGNGNNYATVKTMEIHASTDGENYTQVGGFTFSLPWTAPDGTVVTGATSPLIPGDEVVSFSEPVTARYFRLVITETNNTNGACQVSYFKAFSKL